MGKMKRSGHIRIGGIRNKVIFLSLITIFLLAAAFVAIFAIQGNSISQVFTGISQKEQSVIRETTDEAMDQEVTRSLGRVNRMGAEFADDLFSDALHRVWTLAESASRMYAKSEIYSPRPYSAPDPNNDGQWTTMTLFAPGVDENDPAVKAKTGLIANQSDLMIAICESTGITDIYFGLPEGVMFTANYEPSTWFVDGKLREYDPRGRMWYQEAVKSGGLIFTDGEWDINTGKYCVECAVPVYDPADELRAVAGIDVYLDDIEDELKRSTVEGEYCLLINQDGKAVLPMQAEVFPMSPEDRDRDLRESGNEYLSQVVRKALNLEKMDVTLAQLNGENYYIVASPIPTTGWVLLSAYSQATAGRSAAMLNERLAKVQDETVATYQEKMAGSQTTAVILLAAVVLLMFGGAAVVGGRIVKPLNLISRRISGLKEGNLEFRMEDAFRTGDEVEELAESFAELSRRNHEYMDKVVSVTAEKERIGTELAVANQIQATMLPHLFPAFPERSEFDIFASMKPAKEVGGDFYDYFLIDDDHLGLVIADVSGKGVPAALYMMASKIIISYNAMEGKSPAQVLADTNAELCENEQEDMFVTVWIGILELSTGKLTAANGGHEYPVLMRDGRFELYQDVHGLVVGGIPGMTYENYEVMLKPGDKLFVYTDGIPEAHNKERKMFGTDRMVAALNTDPEADLQTLLKNMRTAVDEFADGAEQFDDLTMLCVEYKGKEQGGPTE
jgi:sigma-B regulation protein RsbU (phosphoserine phosphatase)